MRLCGEYQSEISRLEYENDQLRLFIKGNKNHAYLKTERDPEILRKYANDMLRDYLFMELKTGSLYI
jgi:hypothetical protein